MSYGPVTVTVELWEKIDEGWSHTPPTLVIPNIRWMNNTLYVFNADGEKKTIYFTRGDSQAAVFKLNAFAV